MEELHDDTVLYIHVMVNLILPKDILDFRSSSWIGGCIKLQRKQDNQLQLRVHQCLAT